MNEIHASHFNALNIPILIKRADDILSCMTHKMDLNLEHSLRLAEQQMKVCLADNDNHSVIVWQLIVTECMERIIRRDDPETCKDNVWSNGGFQ